MVNFEMKLRDFLKKHPDCLSNAITLKGTLRDNFPGEDLKIRLLLYAYESNIMEIIKKPGRPDRKDIEALNRILKKLVSLYGITEDNAYWAVDTWLVAMGKKSHGSGQHKPNRQHKSGGDINHRRIDKSCRNVDEEPPTTPEDNPLYQTAIEVLNRSSVRPRDLEWLFDYSKESVEVNVRSADPKYFSGGTHQKEFRDSMVKIAYELARGKLAVLRNEDLSLSAQSLVKIFLSHHPIYNSCMEFSFRDNELNDFEIQAAREYFERTKPPGFQAPTDSAMWKYACKLVDGIISKRPMSRWQILQKLE